MNLTESEKRLAYQIESTDQIRTLHELAMMNRYTRKSEIKEATKSLLAKLRSLSADECMAVVRDVQKNYHLPDKPRTIGEQLAEAGTYANELDRITIAKDVNGQYTFNMTGYDESGNFLFLSGSIDNDNGNYVRSISDDESLKSENDTDSGFKQPLTAYDNGILSEMGKLIPYVPLTADIIGKDSHVFGTLNFGTLKKVPSGDFERYVGMSGVDPDATQDLYVYLTVVDYLVYGITKDGIIIFKKQLISANPAIPQYNSIEFIDLPEEIQSVNPCICRDINDTSRYYLTWELENAYYIMEVWDRGDEKRVLNIFMTTDLQYCNWFDNSELVSFE